jgi:hypothetical protein
MRFAFSGFVATAAFNSFVFTIALFSQPTTDLSKSNNKTGEKKNLNYYESHGIEAAIIINCLET